MALWKSPCAAGIVRSVATLMPPADSPKIVTLPGSPPNAATLLRTHSSAATWSRMPSLPVDGIVPFVSSFSRTKPNGPMR